MSKPKERGENQRPNFPSLKVIRIAISDFTCFGVQPLRNVCGQSKTSTISSLGWGLGSRKASHGWSQATGRRAVRREKKWTGGKWRKWSLDFSEKGGALLVVCLAWGAILLSGDFTSLRGSPCLCRPSKEQVCLQGPRVLSHGPHPQIGQLLLLL